jgi:hypothetical protein
VEEPKAAPKPDTEGAPAKDVPKPVAEEPVGQAKSPIEESPKPATEEAPAKPTPTPDDQEAPAKPVEEPEAVEGKKETPTPDEPETAVKSPVPAPAVETPVPKAPIPKPSKTLRNAWKRLKKATGAESKAQEAVTAAEERVAKAKKAIAEQAQKGKKPLMKHSDELGIAERKHANAVKALKKISDAKTKNRANAERLEKHYELEKAWAEQRFELWRDRARAEIAARKAGTSKQHEYSPERAAEQDARIAAAQKELGSDRVMRGTPEEPHAIWDEKNPKKGQGFDKPELEKHPTDPIKDLSDADLAKLAATGETPAGFTGEVEHRIPQRVAKMLVDSGLPVDLAVKLSKLTDKSNLDPTTAEFHGGSDTSRRGFMPKAPDGTPLGSMDARQRAPLMSATPDEIAAIADALRSTPGVDLDKKHVIDRGRPARKVEVAGESPGAPKATIEVPKQEPLKMSWREILEAARKSHGASARWEPL